MPEQVEVQQVKYEYFGYWLLFLVVSYFYCYLSGQLDTLMNTYGTENPLITLVYPLLIPYHFILFLIRLRKKNEGLSGFP